MGDTLMNYLGDNLGFVIFFIIIIVIGINILRGNLKLDSNDDVNNVNNVVECKTQKVQKKALNHKEINRIKRRNKDLIKKNNKIRDSLNFLCSNNNYSIEFDAIARVVQNKKDFNKIKDDSKRNCVIVTDVEDCYNQLKIENKKLNDLYQKIIYNRYKTDSTVPKEINNVIEKDCNQKIISTETFNTLEEDYNKRLVSTEPPNTVQEEYNKNKTSKEIVTTVVKDYTKNQGSKETVNTAVEDYNKSQASKKTFNTIVEEYNNRMPLKELFSAGLEYYTKKIICKEIVNTADTNYKEIIPSKETVNTEKANYKATISSKKVAESLKRSFNYDELLFSFACNEDLNSKENRLFLYNKHKEIKLKDGNTLGFYDKIKICVRQAILHELSKVKTIQVVTDKNNFQDSMGANYLFDQFPFQNIKSSSYTSDIYTDRADNYYETTRIDEEELNDNMIHFDAESEVSIMYDDRYENYNSFSSNKNYERYEPDVINIKLPDFKNFRYPKINILLYNTSCTYQVPKILAFLSFQWIINNSNFVDYIEKKSFSNHLKGLSDFCIINKGYDSGYYKGKDENEYTYSCPIGISFCINQEYYGFEESITRNLQEVCDLLVKLNDLQLSEEGRWELLKRKESIFFDRMYDNLNLTTDFHKKLLSAGHKDSCISYKNAKDFLFKLYKERGKVSDMKSLNIRGFYEYDDMCMIILDNIYINDVLLAIILFKEDLSINFCCLKNLDLDLTDKYTYYDLCNKINESKGWIRYEVIDKDDLSYLIILGDPIYYNWNEKLEKNMSAEIVDEFKVFYEQRTSYVDNYTFMW